MQIKLTKNKQAFWKYCLKQYMPLPAPTNIKEALLLQKQIKLNYICLKSISQKRAEKSSEIQKETLPRCIHHFKSDLINNMDHMRISGTEPSSVVLSQRSYFKS